MERMEESDAGALAQARAGDSDGFRTLVERHSRGIFRLAYRMTSNEQDAEDVVQGALRADGAGPGSNATCRASEMSFA